MFLHTNFDAFNTQPHLYWQFGTKLYNLLIKIFLFRPTPANINYIFKYVIKYRLCYCSWVMYIHAFLNKVVIFIIFVFFDDLICVWGQDFESRRGGGQDLISSYYGYVLLRRHCISIYSFKIRFHDRWDLDIYFTLQSVMLWLITTTFLIFIIPLVDKIQSPNRGYLESPVRSHQSRVDCIEPYHRW